MPGSRIGRVSVPVLLAFPLNREVFCRPYSRSALPSSRRRLSLYRNPRFVISSQEPTATSLEPSAATVRAGRHCFCSACRFCPQRSFVFGADVRQECGRGKLTRTTQPSVRRYSGVNRRLRQKSYNYFGDFSELAIPQSRSWLCDAVIHLACAAR